MGMAGSGWAPRGRETRLHRADQVVRNVRLDRVPADPYPALGGVGARARPKHEDRQRAGVLGIPQRRRGAEIGDAYLGASCAQEALADVRNGPDPVLPDSVRVDRDVKLDAGRPDILRKRRERGFEQVSRDAGAWPTGLGGRGLGAGEELGVPGPAGPDPFRNPVPELVGFGRIVLVVCSFHRVASGSALR